MAKNTVRRWIQIIFDRPSAKKAEGEMGAALGAAGKKGGENFVRELKAAFDKRMATLKVQLAKGLVSPEQFKKLGNDAAKDFNAGIVSGMEAARKAGKVTDAEFLKLARTLKKVGDDGAVAGTKVSSTFLKASTAVAGFFAARFGVQQFAKFFTDSIRQALDAEDSFARLDAVLKPLGLSYQQTAQEVEGFLERIQKTTRFSDGDAREALVNLVTATGDYRKSLSLLDVTAKIAEKRHTTMAEAAQTAADASKGLTKGMKDLGISTKDTGDIVGKINKNLGNLAEEGAKKGSGAVAQMTNLWKQFQEKVGLAIIGSDGLKESIGPNGLLGALIALNDWADKNSGAISGFVNTLVGGAKILSRFSKEILTYIPNPLMLKKAFDAVTGRNKFADVGSGASTTVVPAAAGSGGTRPGGGGGTPSDIAKARGAELERIERDIVVKRLVIEKGLTEELAREAVRRDELITPPLQHETASIEELEAAWKRLGLSNLQIAAGLDQELTPAVKQTETQFAALAEVSQTFAEAQPALAGQFSSPWIDAMGLIRNEVEGQGTLFRELGEAWAEGGIAGLARLAAGKVKENLAQAIEMAAKALGLFAFGNPGAAAAAGKSAALHGAAALAWKTVGNVAGALGGGAASGSGGVGSSAPNQARAEGVQQQTPETHIHFKGSSFFIPEVQKQIYASQLEARQKYGQNAKIIVHRDN